MGRPAKLDLEQVLEHATDLLWERGCDAVTTRDLEAALDLRAPAIYRRFASKDELFARCLDHYTDTVIVGRIEGILERAEDPMVGLHRFFTSLLDPHGSEPRLRGCLLANTATSASGQVPEIHATLIRGWTLMNVAFIKQIQRAQRAGQLDSELDPESVAQSLLMSLQGLLSLTRAGVGDLAPGIDATFENLGWEPPKRAAKRRTKRRGPVA